MTNLASNTRAALVRLAGREEWLHIDTDTVTIDDDCGFSATAHRMDDGRWIVASYDKRSCQWRSGDVRQRAQNFCYAFSNSLSRLASYGVSTYRSPVAALKANLPQ